MHNKNLPPVKNKLVNDGSSLYGRVVKGGAWVFTLRVVQLVFNFTRLIILARILSPEDFGLFGIALLTIATLETFSQTGFQKALIQRKGSINTFLDTAWTLLIIRGVILFTLLFFFAPYASIFFETPDAKPIIQIIAFSVLLQSFSNIGVIYFQKELEFNKQFLYDFSGTLSNFIVAISVALLFKSVWALVLGILAGHLVKLIISYFIHPFKPHLRFDLNKARELFGFGKWIFGSSILIFLLTQGDDIFVGKMLGVAALGFYQMAYKISNIPATEISHVISRVTLPAYSKLQNDIPRLKEAYLKVLQLTTLLSFPIAGMIFILAPDFTRIFLGEKWMPIVPSMQVLSIWGAIRAIGSTSIIFSSVGKPKISTILQFARLIILLIIIYPLTVKWGFFGTALAVTISIIPIEPFTFYYIIRITHGHFLEFAKIILVLLLGTVGMCATLVIVRHFFFEVLGFQGLGAFLLLGFLGLTTHFGISVAYYCLQGYKIKKLFDGTLIEFIK